jgi:hypothetical protein
LPKLRNDPLDEVDFELLLGQSDDRPPCRCRFEILLGILGVTRAPVVAAGTALENATFDFDQGSAIQVPEIRTPFAGGVEVDFPLQRRALRHTPEEEKPGFELRACHLIRPAKSTRRWEVACCEAMGSRWEAEAPTSHIFGHSLRSRKRRKPLILPGFPRA